VRQPSLNLGVLVRDVVVHNQMQVQLRRSLFVDLAQEVQTFLVPLLHSNTRDHLSVGCIERGAELAAHVGGPHAGRRRQDNSGSLRNRLRRTPLARHLLKSGSIFPAQFYRSIAS
jgi:hypothetical protein